MNVLTNFILWQSFYFVYAYNIIVLYTLNMASLLKHSKQLPYQLLQRSYIILGYEHSSGSTPSPSLSILLLLIKI